MNWPIAQPCAGKVQARVRALLDRLEAIISKAMSRDELRAALVVPPDQAAKTLIVFTRGLAVMERLHHEPERLREMAAQMILNIAT